MKDLSLCVFSILFVFQLYSQDLVFQWKHELPCDHQTTGVSIITDDLNNSYVVGKFREGIELDGEYLQSPTTFSGLLFKVDEQGDLKWHKAFGDGSYLTELTDVVIDQNGDILILGNYKNTLQFDTLLQTIHPSGPNGTSVFIAKYTPDGDLIWARNTGGIASFKNSITVDDNNDIIVAARSITVDQFGSDFIDEPIDSVWVDWFPGTPHWGYFFHEYTVLAKFNTQGEFQWSKLSGGFPRNIETDQENNIIVTGFIQGLDPAYYGSNDYIYGGEVVEPTGNHTIFLAKHDINGDLLWLNLCGGSDNNNYGEGLAIDENNNVYLAGRIGGNHVKFGQDTIANGDSRFHAFIAKFSAQGEFNWVNDIGTPDQVETFVSSNFGKALAINSSNELIFGGWFKDSLNFAGTTIVASHLKNIMVLKLDLDGNYLEARQYIGTNENRLIDLTLNSAGDVLLCGQSDITSTIDPSKLLVAKIGAELPTPTVQAINSSSQIKIFPVPGKVGQPINILLDYPTTDNLPLWITQSNGTMVASKTLNSNSFQFIPDYPGVYFLYFQEGSTLKSKTFLVR